MLRTTRSLPACSGRLGLLLGVALLLALPQVATAAPQARSDRLLARGDGYAVPQGSAQVKTLQGRLRTLGRRPGPIDGKYGPLTEGAVRRLQQRAGIAPDGVVGPRTRLALRRMRPRPLRQGVGYGRTDGSRRVRGLQSRLRAAGLRPGPVDGLYGPRTAAAVRRLQARSKLEVDGVVDPRSRAALDEIGNQGRDQDTPASSGVLPKATPPVAEPAANSAPAPSDEGSTPWLPIGIGAAALALIAALLLDRRGTPPWRRRPGPSIIPLGKGLSLEGESADPEIGRFRGTAYAVEIPDLRGAEQRALNSRFYVLDPIRRLPFWVRYQEVHTPLPPALQAHQEPWGQGVLRPGSPVLGYVTVPDGPQRHVQLFEQLSNIEALCRRRKFNLLGVVRDVETGANGARERPGIAYAMEQFDDEKASALVVCDLTRLGRSRAEIDGVLGRLSGRGVALVTLDPELDTSTMAGEEAVRTMASAGGEPLAARNGRRPAPRSRARARGSSGTPQWEAAEPVKAAEGRR